jgi:hypothetical protein
MDLHSYFIHITKEQGILLMLLVMAHIAADFIFQTKKMVEQKQPFKGWMLLHILIVASTTFILTQNWKITLIIGITHWLIDSLKLFLQKKNAYKNKNNLLFIGDQLLHILIILLVWGWSENLFDGIIKTVQIGLNSYQIILTVFSYVFVIWPTAYIIKFATQDLVKPNAQQNQNQQKQQYPQETDIEHGGKRIGQYERIIILTFVLLGKYEAIGFLITGKSIIRFAQRDEKLKSEYVLVGTMMSYGISILIGVLTNWLLGFA